ncbi:glycosyltransferase, partial [Bacillus anthracis]|uniref:glycosyltransferase n=1 Tax=Bacillus anthracis TaxID=1392 RepID=UPI003904A739
MLSILKQRPSFLMVGTLEPRKGHAQVLDAFENLWKGGANLNLVIVGKVGWMVDLLVQRLCSHPELGK